MIIAAGSYDRPCVIIAAGSRIKTVGINCSPDRAAVKRGGDRAKLLLPGRVPHVRLDGLAVMLDLTPRQEGRSQAGPIPYPSPT